MEDGLGGLGHGPLELVGVGVDGEGDGQVVVQGNQVRRISLHCILGQSEEVYVARDGVKRSLLIDAGRQRDRRDATLELGLQLLG